jgi:hypothetical protein
VDGVSIIKVTLCGLLDRVDEGRQWVARLIELIPEPTIAGVPDA